MKAPLQLIRMACLALALGAGLSAHAQVATLPAVPADSRGLPTLAPMLASVTPAVVNISVLSRDPAEDNPLLRDPFFRRFFNVPESQARPQQSAGSGVIVDAVRGLVLTNHHVIKDAQEVLITLKDRRALKAQLVGTDPATDIALLRVPPGNLTALRFGDADQLQVGDFVVAIGNPFGIGQTVTSGIVSALGRAGIGLEGYEDFIQTDASINPGNSGGALVNLRGELIGINTAIIGPSGGNVGIGFAVPVNMARAVMDQILRFGEVRRGRLGVSTEDVTPDSARQLGVPVSEGALVTNVEKGSAAERAGLRPKDVVTSAAGRPVRSSGDLRNRIGLTPVGEEIDLGVLREGRPLRIRARIAEPWAGAANVGEAVPQLAGARIANIEPGMPGYGQVQGAIVVQVEQASAAFRNGIRTGDIFYGVNQRRVRSVAEFLAALRGLQGQPARIQLLRGEQRLALVIR